MAFFICWAPFHIQRLVSAYSSSTPPSSASLNSSDVTSDSNMSSTSNLGEVFFYVSGILYYVSSVINPILYNIMSLKFRQAFKDTIVDCCCCLRGTASSSGPRGANHRRRRRNRLQVQRPWYSVDATAASRQSPVSCGGGGGGGGQRASGIYAAASGSLRVNVDSGGDCDCDDDDVDNGNCSGASRRYRFYGRQTTSALNAGAEAAGIRNQFENGVARPAQRFRRSGLFCKRGAGLADGEFVGLQAIGVSTAPVTTSAVAAVAAAGGGSCEAAEFDVVETDGQRPTTGALRSTCSPTTYGRQAGARSTTRAAVATSGGCPDPGGCRSAADPSAKRWNIGWFRPSRRRRRLEASFA